MVVNHIKREDGIKSRVTRGYNPRPVEAYVECNGIEVKENAIAHPVGIGLLIRFVEDVEQRRSGKVVPVFASKGLGAHGGGHDAIEGIGYGLSVFFKAFPRFRDGLGP